MSSGETEHQRRRRERAERKAERLAAEAERRFDDAHAEVSCIPMGQPILVGHHSETRHRAALKRHDRKMRKAVETLRDAERAESAARRAGASISSDDPEAVAALTAKLEALEARRSEIKAHNRRARKEGAEAFPAYVLANLGANIRRVRKRIAELEAAAMREAAPDILGDGFTITECPEDHRIRFVFASRPSKEVIGEMKRAGFRWSRRHGAWQRHLNEGGRYAAKRMATKLFGWSES